MKAFIVGAALVSALSLPQLAQASTWDVDPAHSAAQFSVRHMMVSNVRGEFSKLNGTVNLDERNPAKSTVEATIDAGSIYTRNDKRDAHLKSADFFDVQKYPTITFKSKKVTPAGKGHYKVVGDLTLHGVTRETVLDAQLSPEEMKDPQGNSRRGLTATTKINRKDFGLTWNHPLAEGGVVVGDEVQVTIDGELVKKADSNASATN